MGKKGRGIKLEELINGNEKLAEQVINQNQGWKSPLQQIRDELNKKEDNKAFEKLKKLVVDIILVKDNPNKTYTDLKRTIEKAETYLKRKEYE